MARALGGQPEELCRVEAEELVLRVLAQRGIGAEVGQASASESVREVGAHEEAIRSVALDQIRIVDNSRLSKKLADLDPAPALERPQQMFAP